MKIDLRDLEREIEAEMTKAVGEIAEMMEHTAKQLAPKDTGELAESIEVHHEGMKAMVGTDSDHAAVEEFGDHEQMGKPYLRPAFDANLNKAVRLIEKRLGNI